MEFLGVGPLELFFIVLIALILLGPRDMVKAGHTIGRFLRRTILSPTWINMQRKVRNLPFELMREAGLDEKDFRVDMQEIQKDMSINLDQVMSRTSPTRQVNTDPVINTPVEPLINAGELPIPPEAPTAPVQSLDSTPGPANPYSPASLPITDQDDPDGFEDSSETDHPFNNE